MCNIYVVMGFSDAGKDSVAKAIQNVSKTTSNIKWSSPMKGMIEYAYGLPEGALNDKEFRVKEVPTLPGVTWNDLMIRCFHHFPQIDPKMMIQKVNKQIETVLSNALDIVITDTRNYSELEEIQRFYFKYLYKVKVIPIWVHSPFETKKESDKYQGNIFYSLSQLTGIRHIIANTGTIEDLSNKVQEVINGH